MFTIPYSDVSYYFDRARTILQESYSNQWALDAQNYDILGRYNKVIALRGSAEQKVEYCGLLWVASSLAKNTNKNTYLTLFVDFRRLCQPLLIHDAEFITDDLTEFVESQQTSEESADISGANKVYAAPAA